MSAKSKEIQKIQKTTKDKESSHITWDDNDMDSSDEYEKIKKPTYIP